MGILSSIAAILPYSIGQLKSQNKLIPFYATVLLPFVKFTDYQ